MPEERLEERLKQVFSNALGLPAEVDVTALAYAQNPAWDSVAHMQLIGALESEFDIMLDTDDVIGLSSFHEAARIVRKYGVE
jgi:acyl carrier protein